MKKKHVMWGAIVVSIATVFTGIGYISYTEPNPNIALSQHFTAEKNQQKPDVIVVLGGGVTQKGFLSDVSQERADFALEVYKEYKVPLLFSGGKTPSGVEAILMNEYAKDNGYTGVDFIEGKSRSTYQNAQYSDELLDQVNIPVDSILLLTSPYHTKRALAVFQDRMPDREIFLTYPEDSVVLSNGAWARIKGLYALMREHAATKWYEMRYNIDIN